MRGRRGSGRRGSSCSRGEEGETTSVDLIERGRGRREEGGRVLACCLNRWSLLLDCICSCSQASVCLHCFFFFLTWIGVRPPRSFLRALCCCCCCSCKRRIVLSRCWSIVVSTLACLTARCTGSSDPRGSMVLHICKPAAAEFTGWLAYGVHPRSGTREDERNTYTQQCTVHRSIDE